MGILWELSWKSCVSSHLGILWEYPYGNSHMGIPWESYGNLMGIPTWESCGNSHGNPAGILWEFPYGNPKGIPSGNPVGIPQKTRGNGMGMGIEIPFPRQPWVLNSLRWGSVKLVSANKLGSRRRPW